jgi:hypothetical protein
MSYLVVFPLANCHFKFWDQKLGPKDKLRIYYFDVVYFGSCKVYCNEQGSASSKPRLWWIWGPKFHFGSNYINDILCLVCVVVLTSSSIWGVNTSQPILGFLNLKVHHNTLYA